MRWGYPVAALVFCSWLALTAPSRAQQSYDALIQEALQEFGDGNFVEARILFERADKIKPTARTLRALGFCDYELKHYVDAVRELQGALTDTRNPLTKAQRAEVDGTLAKAQRFIGELVLETDPPNASVLLDGRAVQGRRWKVDAGEHVLAASAAGYRNSDVKLAVSAGQDTHTRLALSPIDVGPAHAALATEPIASEPAPTVPAATITPNATEARDTDSAGLLTKWWFWTAVGVVVAGATVGTLVALDKPEKTNSGTSGVILHAQ